MTKTDGAEVSHSTRSLPAYRRAIDLASTLLDHISVAIEEGLYSQAFDLLYSTLISGTDTPRPAHVPRAQYVALATTLAVHPSMTTRTTSKDKHNAADDAVRYLLALNKVVGASAAHFDQALSFGMSDDRAARLKTRKSLNFEEDFNDDLRCVFVDQQALSSHTDDLWHLLGWSLNCSVVLERRWERWKLLLSLILDAFEDDLMYTLTRGHADLRTLGDTLIVQHLSTVGAGRDNRRKIMRAVLADGTSKALAEFREVFKDETANPKLDKSKRRTLDLEHGDFGDYNEVSDEETPAMELRRSRNYADTGVQPATTAFDFSNHEAAELRIRMLALLTQVCIAEPTAFLNVEELFDLYAEFLRPLPVRSFQIMIVGIGRRLDADAHSSLYQMLLRASIDASAPVYNMNDLKQDQFETHFAPFAANSSATAENCKVSLLVEGLMRLLWKHDMLSYTSALRNSVNTGVQARLDKTNASSRQQGTDQEYEEACLRASGERILCLLSMMQSKWK